VGPWPLLQFVIFFYTDSRTPWTSDQPVAKSLPTQRTTQTQNKRTQTSMPLVGFEPTIPDFERAKTVHALDRAATVIDSLLQYFDIFQPENGMTFQSEKHLAWLHCSMNGYSCILFFKQICCTWTICTTPCEQCQAMRNVGGYLLGYNAVQSVENQQKFRRKISPPSSGPKNMPSKIVLN
jgi:hypothetical protein